MNELWTTKKKKEKEKKSKSPFILTECKWKVLEMWKHPVKYIFLSYEAVFFQNHGSFKQAPQSLD